MIKLPSVTLITVNTREPRHAIEMLRHCRMQVAFRGVCLFTDVESIVAIKASGKPDWLEMIPIQKIRSGDDYSAFMMNSLPYYSDKFLNDGKRNGHILVAQCDGYVINADKWDDAFLEYDYIGAPFSYNENVMGNGGFSLRSVYLLQAIRDNERFFRAYANEDFKISYTYRPKLEMLGVQYAPMDVARQFSSETGNYLTNPTTDTFGFHSRAFIKRFGLTDFGDVSIS